MRKCNNCNITLGDGDRFCPMCGMATVPVQQEQPTEPEQPAGSVKPEMPVQPVSEPYRNPAAEQKPAKKKKTGLIIGIIAAVALLAVAAVVLTSLFKNKNKPMAQFYNAQNRFMTATMRGGNSIEDVLRGKADGVNTEISTDAVLRVAAEGFEIMGLDILDKFDISFSINTRGEEDLFGLGINYKGSPVLTGTVKTTENDIYCYLPELSDEYYAIDRELLMGLMDVDALNTEPVDYDKVENLSRAYDDIKSRYEAILLTGVAEEDFSSEKGDVRLTGLDEMMPGASTVIYRPNKDRLADMIAKIGTELKNDEALADYLLSLFDHYLGGKGDMVFSAVNAETGEEQDMMGALREYGEQLEQNAAEIANNIAESELEWRCVTDDGNIVAQYMTSKDFSFSLEQPDDLRSYIRFEPADSDSSFTVIRDLEKTGDKLGGEIRFESKDANSLLSGRFTLNSVDENTKSAFGVPYGSYRLDVNMTGRSEDGAGESHDLSFDISVGAKEGGGTEHRLTVNGLSELIDDEEIPDSITLFLDTTDQDSTVRAPSEEPTRIENEEDFQSALSELSDSLMTVVYRLMLRISLSGE